MSSLFNDFNQVPFNQMGDFLTQFNNFRANFSGDPEMQVKQLIQSGRMSQDQFNSFAQTANMIRQFIK